MFLILLYRWLIYFYYIRQAGSVDSELWERLFLFGVFLSGAIWGGLSLLFLEFYDIKYELLILVTVVGIASSSVTTLNASRFAYPIFVLPALLPFASIFYLHGGDIHNTLAVMLGIFIVMTLFLGRRAHSYTIRLLALDVENKDLILRLENWNSSLLEKNEEIETAWDLQTKDKQLLEKMFENTDVLIAYMDKAFRYIRVNKAFADAGNQLPEYFVGKNHFDIYPDEENEGIFDTAITSRKAVNVEAKPYQHPQLGLSYWNWSLQPVLDHDSHVQGLLLSVMDVTRARMAELEALRKERYLHTIMETAADGIITADVSGNIESINSMGAAIFGYQQIELIGKNLSVLMPHAIGQRHEAVMQSYIENKSESQILGRVLETTGCRYNGDEFPISVTVSESEIQGRIVFTGIFRDISKHKKDRDDVIQARNEAEHLNTILQEKNLQLEYLSSNDALTGIANRRKYNELIEREWQRAKRNTSSLSVIIIDIDHFKAYNDFYGHQSGDECLRRVAQILSGALKRATDFIARYGGEEFVCVLPETSLDNAVIVAEGLRTAIESARLEHERSLTQDVITISAGVACMTPGAEQTIGDLVSLADKALYKAKNEGRNRVVS